MPEKSRVALVGCETYAEEDVYAAVKKGVDILGSMLAFVNPAENILVKPNVLFGTNPDKCVTTHPSVMKAVSRLLLECGVSVSCGDSAGFGSCESNMRRAGLKAVADELGIMLADFDAGREVVHQGARLNKRFLFANGVLAADGLVSVSKLKTHGFLRFTGAIKNQFGCIPGLAKGQFHIKMPDPYDFAAMLVDINTYLKPRLCVMDGIVAMEGNGPRSGNPRKLNVLLFSTDPVALDSIACSIINLEPRCVPTLGAGELAGLGYYGREDIEVVGDDLESFTAGDFDVVRKVVPSLRGGKMMAFIKNQASPRPVIDKAKCTRCGICIDVCPVSPKALAWAHGDKANAPVHNYDRCIRCFCCQELCSEGAIHIRNTLLGSLLTR